MPITKYRLLCSVILSLFHYQALASDNTINTEQTVLFRVECPQPSSLIKNGNAIWLTKDKWQSFNPSFVTKLTRFLGAEWQGVHVGHLLCQYSDDSGLTFPVSMQAPFLAETPKQGVWQPSPTKANTMVCNSTRLSDCWVNGIRKASSKLTPDQQVQQFLKNISPKSANTN